jgi:hypothetical protein
LAQKVQAQGLIGAPVDPRYGGSGEVGGLADYGYDTARDIGRIVTMSINSDNYCLWFQLYSLYQEAGQVMVQTRCNKAHCSNAC